MVFIDASGQHGCYDKINITSGPDRCAVVYSTVSRLGTYDSLVDVISLFIVQQNIGLQSKSPFADTPLLTDNNTPGTRNGRVVLINSSVRDVMITSWGPSEGVVMNTSISSR